MSGLPVSIRHVISKLKLPNTLTRRLIRSLTHSHSHSCSWNGCFSRRINNHPSQRYETLGSSMQRSQALEFVSSMR